MDESTRRIVVLGKTGAGKSSIVNTICGETVCDTDYTANSSTTQCQAVTRNINGKSTTWIDTPGFFDTDRSEEMMKPEILRCITECAPGPHVFLIVLKMGEFTAHEQEVFEKLRQYFSDEALKFATVLFTFGDQLPEGMKIEEYVEKCKALDNLVKECGGRCHVIDNKRWKKNQEDKYRTNKFQVKELLKTIDEMIEEHKGGCFTHEMLQAVKTDIQQEQENIRRSSANMSPEENMQKAIAKVLAKRMLRSLGVTTGALLGAFLGGAGHLMTTNKQELPTVVLLASLAIGTAAGVAAGVDLTGGASAAKQPDSSGDDV